MKKIVTFCFLLTFLLLFFSLFLAFSFGTLGFLEAGCVSAASFAFILRVRELLLTRYPLVMSADWTLTVTGFNLNVALYCYHEQTARCWRWGVNVEVNYDCVRGSYWRCVCWGRPLPHLHCPPVQRPQGWPAFELPGRGAAYASSQTNAAWRTERRLNILTTNKDEINLRHKPAPVIVSCTYLIFSR